MLAQTFPIQYYISSQNLVFLKILFIVMNATCLTTSWVVLWCLRRQVPVACGCECVLQLAEVIWILYILSEDFFTHSLKSDWYDGASDCQNIRGQSSTPACSSCIFCWNKASDTYSVFLSQETVNLLQAFNVSAWSMKYWEVSRSSIIKKSFTVWQILRVLHELRKTEAS